MPRLIEQYENKYPTIFANNSQHRLNLSFREALKDTSFFTETSHNDSVNTGEEDNSPTAIFSSNTNVQFSSIKKPPIHSEDKKQEHANRLSMSS